MALLAGVFSAGCRRPEYVKFASDFGDLEGEVPWGWTAYLDKQGTDFYSYTFVGPFDPDFFRGVPSISVRWYAYKKYRFMPGNEAEMYTSAQDYIDKMLKWVYGPERSLEQPMAAVKVSGWSATKFVVAAPADVSGAAPFGVLRDAGTGRTAVLRWHGYIVVPMDNGFYVLVYPATRDGFKRYEGRFVHLIKTLRIKKDGPAGEVLAAPQDSGR